MVQFESKNYPQKTEITEAIRVKGTVQGVGFRPTVYRLAKANQLRGEVSNDGQGVLIIVTGDRYSIDNFIEQLQQEKPPLAQINAIIRHKYQEKKNLTILPLLKVLITKFAPKLLLMLPLVPLVRQKLSILSVVGIAILLPTVLIVVLV